MSIRIVILLLISFLAVQSSQAQVTGSFRSKQAGAWNDFNTWERYDGTAWVAATTGQYPNDPTVDVTIQAHTVLVTTTAPIPPYAMRNLTVENGGKLYTGIVTTGGRYLSIHGTSLVCDGVIGNYPSLDDIGFNIEGTNVTISGSSPATSFAATRIRKNFNASSGGVATTNLFINRSLYLTYNGTTTNSTQLYNNITGTFNVTIASGVTVNLMGYGNVSIDGTAGADGNSSRGTITVNGTLNIPGTLFLKTNNTGSPGNSLIIGPNGVVNAAAVNAGASGSAGHSLVLQENAVTGIGGKLNITGTTAFSAFSLTNNTFNLGTYYATVEYSATANQVVRNELTYAKLTLSGSGNKILQGNTTVNSNLLVNGAALDVTTVPQILTVGGNVTLQNGGSTTTNALNYLTVATTGTGNQLIGTNAQTFQAFAVSSTKNSGSLILLPNTPLRIKTDLILNMTGPAVFSDGGNTIRVGDDALFGSGSSASVNFSLSGTLHFTFEGTTTSDFAILSDVGLTNVTKAQLNDVLVDPMLGASQSQLYVQPAVGTQFLTIKGDLAVANTIALQPSIWLNANTVSLRGDLSVYDITGFQTGAGKVSFTGNAPQSITSPNGVKFYTFEMNNTVNVSLSTDVVIENQLFLLNGLVATNDNEVFITTTTADAVSGQSTSSYIVGNLRRAVAPVNTYDFPVGTQEHFQLAVVTLHAATGLNELLVYFNAGLPTDLPDPSETNVNGTPITDMLNGGYWTVEPDAYTAIDYDITLYEQGWNNFTGAPVQLGVIKRDDAASPWWGTNAGGGPDGLQGMHTNETQSTANGLAVAKRTHLLSLSDFAIGFGNAALPVSLLEFTATATNDAVILNWQTASETENERFDVKRSSDGVDFITIGILSGHGTSDETHRYTFHDKHPLNGINYYRLAQIDTDGSVHYSPIRAAKINIAATNLLTVFPIPARDQIYVSGAEPGSEITIFDLAGKERHQIIIDDAVVLLPDDLTAGIYVLVARTPDGEKRTRFGVQ